MQPALSSPIPDASLAVFPVNGENSHQGFVGENPAPNQVREVCNFTVLLGMRGQAELNRIGSRCTGKERDAESGNDYFKYRYYASSTGRWLSPDPSGLEYANLADPQSLNLYSYVGNKPLTLVDLEGLCWKGFQWACDLGRAIKNGAVAVKNGFEYGQWTPNTKQAEIRSLDQQEAQDRNAEYQQETQGAGSAPGQSPLRYIVCEELFSDPLTLTALTGKTSGVGVGGSAGVGAGFAGGYLSLSVDEVADPQGNVGLLFNVGGGPFAAGLGAQGGGQAMLSQAKTVQDLSGNGTDYSGSFAMFGLDLSKSMKDGSWTATGTLGPGVGTRVTTSLGESHTWVPFSMHCN